MTDLRIGTSGWSYPSGPGTWNGIFYPHGRTVGGRKFDELAFYAEHFDTVEVNVTFYRLPDPEMTRKWAERTPGGFEFAVKLFQKFTHPAMYEKTVRQGSRAESDLLVIPSASLGDADAFKAAIDPLARAGKLGPLLAQFPPSFRNTPEAQAYLDWLREAFRGYPLAVELRHRSWSDHAAETIALLGSLGAAWAQIDEPKFRFSIRQDHLPNLRGLYYMRLHGRNADTWWTHDHPDERYNYLYSPQEVSSIRDTIAAVRRLVQKVYVFANNHFAAKAVANAATLKHELGEPVPGSYSKEMLDRYPFLRGFVEAAPGFGPPHEPSARARSKKKGKQQEGPAGGADTPEE